MSAWDALILVVVAAPAALSATYALHAEIAFRRGRARRGSSPMPGPAPSLSVIVPVCGPEESLADNVRGLLAQRVPGGHEVILCAERDDDAGLASLAPLLAAVAAARVAPRIVIAGRGGDGPSKAHLLAAGVAAARGERLAFVDADTRVRSAEFLADASRALDDPRVGLVTCLPVHREARDLGAALLGDLMHTDLIGLFVSGAAWGRLELASGACLLTRRDALSAAGGLEPLAGRMLFDTALARAVRGAGFEIALNAEPVVIARAHARLTDVARQCHRWHVALARNLSSLAFVSFCWLRATSLLAALALALSPSPAVRGVALAALAVRAASAAFVERRFVRARRPWLLALAWPMAELVAASAWIPALATPVIEWRGRRYRVDRDGVARGVAASAPAPAPGAARPLSAAWRFLRASDWLVHLPIIGVALLAVAVGRDRGLGSSWPRIAWILTLQTLLVAAGYWANDVADRDADRVKLGGAPRSRAEVRAKALLAALAIAGGLAMSAALGWPMFAVAVAWVAAGLAYSLPGLRLKERGLVGVFTAAALQRIVPFVWIAGRPPDAAEAAVACWLFALGLLFILEHQIDDVDDDSRAGVRTWTTRVGRGRASALRGAAVATTWVCAWLAAALSFAARVAAPLGGANEAVHAASSGPNRWLVAVAAALVLPAATLLATRLLAWRFVASRRLPRRPVLRGSEAPVRIYGAGLAGLTAALALAEWGRDVEVYEQRLEPGGMASDSPYVHSLNEDPERIERWLGMPIACCFTRVSRETAYLNGWRVPGSGRHWNCVRGAMPGALDRHLLDLAIARGIPVRFGAPFRPGVEPARGVTIVATGHSRAGFDALGLRSEPLEGYVSVAPWDGEPLLVGYRSSYTRSGYGYVAAAGGHLYALLFSRGPIEAGALAAFERDLERTEGIVMPGWSRRRGATPCETCFERGGFRLAGSVAGMIDPFYLSGVGPALISGGVAALAEVDPENARRRFARLTRTFALKRALARMTWGRGASPLRVLGAAALNGVLAPVGTVRRG